MAAGEKLHYGVHIENPDYSGLAKWTGGVGHKVSKPLPGRCDPTGRKLLGRTALVGFEFIE